MFIAISSCPRIRLCRAVGIIRGWDLPLSDSHLLGFVTFSRSQYAATYNFLSRNIIFCITTNTSFNVFMRSNETSTKYLIMIIMMLMMTMIETDRDVMSRWNELCILITDISHISKLYHCRISCMIDEVLKTDIHTKHVHNHIHNHSS